MKVRKQSSRHDSLSIRQYIGICEKWAQCYCRLSSFLIEETIESNRFLEFFRSFKA